VDVLQLVAVTLSALQAFAWLARTPRRLGIWSLVAAGSIVLVTPIIWRVHWASIVPMLLASYLSAGGGSLFPLFPWAAYVFVGAALGVWFVAAHQDQTTRTPTAFLRIGLAMFAAGALLHRVPFSPYGATDFWTTSPNLFLFKAGSVLLLLAVTARITRTLKVLPAVVTALSRESLTVYLVHVCILYGSIWNTGLLQIIGPRLDLLTAVTWIMGLAGSMCLLAWVWHECKRRQETLALLVRVTATVSLLYTIA
jgi:surface polysaccharide O-acyltransferase-like enzyme